MENESVRCLSSMSKTEQERHKRKRQEDGEETQYSTGYSDQEYKSSSFVQEHKDFNQSGYNETVLKNPIKKLNNDKLSVQLKDESEITNGTDICLKENYNHEDRASAEKKHATFIETNAKPEKSTYIEKAKKPVMSCLGILPGFGIVSDSSDSENTSDSDIGDNDFDLVGRSCNQQLLQAHHKNLLKSLGLSSKDVMNLQAAAKRILEKTV